MAVTNAQQLREAFNKLDQDRDGYIALSELGRSFALVNLNKQLTPKQQKRLINAYKRIDDDHDGRLDYNDFVRALTKPDFNANCCHKFLYRIVDVVSPRSQSRHFYSNINDHVCQWPPIFFVSLSIAQIILYIYYCIDKSYVQNHWFDGCPGCFQNETEKSVNSSRLGLLVFAPELKNEAWRYGSHVLIHAGFLHLFANLIIELFVGIPLEYIQSTCRIGLLYILGTIFSALCHTIIDPQSILVGASAGSYSILSAHVFHLFLNWREMRWCWWRVISLLLFFGFDLSAAIFRRYTPGLCGAETGISMVSHFGGFLTGLTIGHLLVTPKNHMREKCGGILRFLAPIAYFGLFTAVLCLNCISPIPETLRQLFSCNITA